MIPVMKKMSFALLAGMMMLAAPMKAQTQVTTFQPGATSDGVTYALPTTGITIKVVSLKVNYTPGEFARYAERLLLLHDVEQQPSTSWTIVELKMDYYGQPDTTKVYTVKLKDKSLAPLVSLSNEGLLMAVNNPTRDIISTPPDQPYRFRKNDNPAKYLSQEILQAANKAKMAELTAQEIFDIREAKSAIIKGEADNMPQDGESLKTLLQQLDQKEQGLTSLFLGVRDSAIVTSTYTFVPTTSANKKTLFRFSSHFGPVDADDLSGEPVTISVEDLHTVNLPTEEELAKRKITGLVYNIPGMAEVTVTLSGKTLAQQKASFAQFGTTDQLMPVLFNKGATTRVTFSTVTGAMQVIEQ